MYPPTSPPAPPAGVVRLREQLMAVARRMRRPDTAAALPLTLLQLLSSIDRLGAGASPSALAERNGLRSSNLAALLRQSEQAGLIERHSDANDRRQVRVLLTASGLSLLESNRDSSARWLAAALQSRLSAAEREQLLRAAPLLERLLDQPPLDGGTGPGPAP